MLEGVKMIQTNLFSMLEKNYGLEVSIPRASRTTTTTGSVLVVEDEKRRMRVVPGGA
jgi:actin-like ATPase involved in cell morphogenesis